MSSPLALLESLTVTDIEREIADQTTIVDQANANIASLSILLDAARAREAKAVMPAHSNGNGHVKAPEAGPRTDAIPIPPRKQGRQSHAQRVGFYLEQYGASRLEHLAKALNIPIDTVRVIAADHLEKRSDGRYQLPTQ